MSDNEEPVETETLPLDAWHRAKGARMVPFAGYEMPIQYEGILAEHEWLPPLWIREVLTENGALRERLLARIAPEIAPHLARRFAAAKRDGALNAGLDPRLTVVSLIGLTIFPLAAQSIWKRVLDADDVDADALTRHTLALLEGGIGASVPARSRKTPSRRRRTKHREVSS